MSEKDNNEVEIPVKIVSHNNSQSSRNLDVEKSTSMAPEHHQEAAMSEEADVFEQLRAEVEQNSEYLEDPEEFLTAIEEASKSPEAVKRWVVPLMQGFVKAHREAWDNRDRWLRASADLENFKRRTLREKSNLLEYKNEELLRDLLPVVDNLERALNHSVNSRGDSAFAEGVVLIAGMFRDVLERYGVKEIAAKDEKFDPMWHEALSCVPMPDKEPNTIIQELEKGYTYQDRLLRPSRVVVSGAVDATESGTCKPTGESE